MVFERSYAADWSVVVSAHRPPTRLVLPMLRLVKTQRSQRTQRAKEWKEQMLPFGVGEPIESKSRESRLLVSCILLLIGLVGLVFSWRLYELQVAAHERYAELSNGNRVRESVNYALRGKIYDRHGYLLADNTLVFRLSVTPYLLNRDVSQRQSAYELIAKLSSLKLDQIKQVAEGDGLDYPLPKGIEANLDHRVALALQAHLPRLAGWQLNEVPIRSYDDEAGLAHIVGYTGTASQADLSADQALLPIDIVGKTGIEAQYDQILRGQHGLERTEVDTLGRPVRMLAKQVAQPGQDITLSIDIEIQRAMAAELEIQMKKANVRRASAVALDPNTGEVLAMVSVPWYDHNLFARGISTSDFERLRNDPDQPLVNKAIAGGYTTGSTIKPMVAAAALEEKVVTPATIIVDKGEIRVTSVYEPGRAFVFRGWRPGGLGPMNVRSGLAMSSNIYFYTVGGGHGDIDGLGMERLTNYYRQFGLGEVSGIDLPGEIAGRVPDSEWKKAYFGTDWFVGDTYNISIGQGDLLISPLQLTLGNMAVANGGYLLKPQLLYKIGSEVVAARLVRREIEVSKQNLQIVREGLRQVVTNGTTCECVFSKVPVKVAGKTGTAQTTSTEERRPHAWFVAYAPFDEPRIMGGAMLEEGSGGSQYAAPVLASGMTQFFKSQ